MLSDSTADIALSVSKNLKEEVFRDTFASIDLNNDGFVTLDEYHLHDTQPSGFYYVDPIKKGWGEQLYRELRNTKYNTSFNYRQFINFHCKVVVAISRAMLEPFDIDGNGVVAGRELRLFQPEALKIRNNMTPFAKQLSLELRYRYTDFLNYPYDFSLNRLTAKNAAISTLILCQLRLEAIQNGLFE